MNKKAIIVLIVLSFIVNTFTLEYFRGYISDNTPVYSVYSLLKSKYVNNSKFNENYFHEAQFQELGITIFTNIIFSKTFMDKNECKLHCIITFKNNEKYVMNLDFNKDSYTTDNNIFKIQMGDNYISFDANKYNLHVENSDIKLSLTYLIQNPPEIFGDGIISIDARNFLAFSWPVIGAVVKGDLVYKSSKIILNGKGSIGHDYNHVAPLNNPRKWRSFWLYNDIYSINIHTIILTDKTQIDRITIYKDGMLLKSFLNSGLKTTNFVKDSNNFSYPNHYAINYTDTHGDKIEANLQLRNITDKIQAFANLTPGIHKIVSMAVGEMWAYRFWTDADINLKINGKDEYIKIYGIGNYVDTDADK